MALAFVTIASYAQQAPRKPQPWDTCTFVEGKGVTCHAAEKARKFEDYLSIGWTHDPVDGFTMEFEYGLVKPAEYKVSSAWREDGQLGNSRIRSVNYMIDGSLYGENGVSVMIAERNDGLWIPLMKIAGDLPQPVVFRNGGVIAISRDFGGNVPMIATWAWVWNGKGPLLMNANDAIPQAAAKLGTGYGCFEVGIDWESLFTSTSCFHETAANKGTVGNKPSFHYQLQVWFELKGAQLVPMRVELEDFAQEGPREEPKHWP